MAFNFKKVKAKFTTLKQSLPIVIQNLGQQYFVRSFDGQQWDGVAWQPRKDKKNVRKLLVRRGQLRRAVAGSKREATFNRIRFEVFVQSKKGYNYAQIHNEGGVINKGSRSQVLNFNRRGRFQRQRTERQQAGTSYSQKVSIGAHSIKIPRRKFLGQSRQLDTILRNKFNTAVADCFK